MQHHDSGPHLRVLVVEDDPVCRRYTSEALRQAGSTVKQTDCIRRALRLALVWRPGREEPGAQAAPRVRPAQWARAGPVEGSAP